MEEFNKFSLQEGEEEDRCFLMMNYKFGYLRNDIMITESDASIPTMFSLNKHPSYRVLNNFRVL